VDKHPETGFGEPFGDFLASVHLVNRAVRPENPGQMMMARRRRRDEDYTIPPPPFRATSTINI
jgi:hypothetical protein